MRLGMLVQSRFFDGVTPTWNHVDCCLKGSGKRLKQVVRKHWGIDSPDYAADYLDRRKSLDFKIYDGRIKYAAGDGLI